MSDVRSYGDVRTYLVLGGVWGLGFEMVHAWRDFFPHWRRPSVVLDSGHSPWEVLLLLCYMLLFIHFTGNSGCQYRQARRRRKGTYIFIIIMFFNRFEVWKLWTQCNLAKNSRSTYLLSTCQDHHADITRLLTISGLLNQSIELLLICIDQQEFSVL